MAAAKKLSADTRLFWVGLTIWGGIFATGLYVAAERYLAVGIVLALVGLLGMLFLIRDHKKRLPMKIGFLVAVAVVTWGTLAYDYYDRHQKGSPVTLSGPLLKAWGGIGTDCRLTVDGSQLVKWSDKYNVAFVCGITDLKVDKFEDERITVNTPFTIYPGDIQMVIPFSKQMLDLQSTIIDEVRKSLPKNTPKGTPFGVPIPTWNELVLLSKTTKSTDIHRLSDIPRYGGYVISKQGLPQL